MLTYHETKLLRYWLRSSAPNYGNCFTFNAMYNQDDEEVPRHTSLTGATNGARERLRGEENGEFCMILSFRPYPKAVH